MSWLHDYIRKKYVTCISFAYLGIIFKKIAKKNFFVFSKFFISDRIFTPKIMTNNLSHVLTSWLYTKKVCDMHIFCILRHNYEKNCKKKIFFWIFKIFHFWLNLYTQNHDKQFVSCLYFMIIYEKSMWHAYPLHTKACKRHSL